MRHKAFLKTYGCQMNKLDSALVTAALKDKGFEITKNVKQADVVLLNTCSVRQHAEQRVLSNLGHLKHIKKTKPDLIVCVAGCMAQRLGIKLLEDECVDIVCGPAQIPKIPELVTQALNEKKKVISITKEIRKESQENKALEKFESIYDRVDEQIQGQVFVRVMRGCDKFCSYCIVPYVRGPEVSRPPAGIIEQIKRLADEGVKQVTLLGQRVNAYKYTEGEKTYSLADLLDMVSQIAGIEWIRFVTSYPSKEYFDDILQAMSDLPKVCNYLHMPAQSGSDKILRAMNRQYTCSEYQELINKAKDTIADIAITGDFIVGFPTETEDDFEQTVDLVKKAQYKNCFIFKYSPRPGTIGEKRLKDDVPDEVKKKRNVELLAVQEKISEQLSRQLIAKQVDVLVEGLSKKPHLDSAESGDRPQLVGRTATDWIVVFNGPQDLAGKFTKVKIARTSPLTLFGELLH